MITDDVFKVVSFILPVKILQRNTLYKLKIRIYVIISGSEVFLLVTSLSKGII